MNHTPGPWTIIQHTGPTKVPARMQGYSFGNNGTEGGIIATYNHANAQLIAAAPELYEACKAVQKWEKTNHRSVEWLTTVWGKLQAAISKAETADYDGATDTGAT